MSCICEFSYNDGKPNGICPKCGQETVDGLAAYNCEYGEEECDVCKHLACNEDC